MSPFATLGHYYPFQRIITSHYLGRLSPLKKDCDHSLPWGMITPWRGLSAPLITLGDYHPLVRIITFHLPLPWETITPSRRLSSLTTRGTIAPFMEDYHLSLPWGTVTPKRGLSRVTTLVDYHLLERIITSLIFTLGDYHPLERIITSHYPGGLSLLREDYHLFLP